MEIHELRNSVEFALDKVHATSTMLATEVCASWCEQQVVRIQHDADHPSEALQVLESQTVYGLSLLLVMADREGRPGEPLLRLRGTCLGGSFRLAQE